MVESKCDLWTLLREGPGQGSFRASSCSADIKLQWTGDYLSLLIEWLGVLYHLILRGGVDGIGRWIETVWYLSTACAHGYGLQLVGATLLYVFVPFTRRSIGRDIRLSYLLTIIKITIKSTARSGDKVSLTMVHLQVGLVVLWKGHATKVKWNWTVCSARTLFNRFMLKIYGLPNIIRYDQKKLIFRKETRCPWLDAVVYLDSEMGIRREICNIFILCQRVAPCPSELKPI